MDFSTFEKESLSIEEKRIMIVEMIDASIELAEKLGKHPLTKGCNCIACVNKRKALIEKKSDSWRFTL